MLGIVVLCYVLRYSADDWDWDIAGYQIGCSNSTNQINLDVTNATNSDGIYAYCTGDEAVYRVGSATACFFALHVLLSFCGTWFHRGLWLWKLILQIGGIIGFILMPEDTFNSDGYVWTARVCSVLFLLLQIILMIGFAYDWNDRWVANSEDENRNEKCWLTLIVASVVGLYAATMAGIVMLYIEFSQCSIGTGITTITLLAVILITGLTLFRDRFSDEPGAALPAGVISAYITYLAWAALDANPDDECRNSAFDGSSIDGSIALGAVIMGISLLWGASQSSQSVASIMHGSKGIPEDAPTAEETAHAHAGLYEVGEGRTAGEMRREQTEARKVPEENEKPGERTYVICFHLVMAITTFYLSMVLTNWGAAEASNSGGKGQMWLRIASQWLTILMYLWTVVAPAILTNRDFSSAGSASTGRASAPRTTATGSGAPTTGQRTVQMV